MHDVHAQHAVGRGVGHDLHEALRLPGAQRPPVDREGELPGGHGDPVGLRLLLRLPTQATSGEV